jgi:osmotically-inducible protein OsmY
MLATEIPRTTPDTFSRCEERGHLIDHGKSLSPGQKTDAAMKASIDRALGSDDLLRAIESYGIVVHVRNGVVYLSGHIVNVASQSRIQNAMGAISGILAVQNNLVLDDRLTLEVAGSLGELEHTYNCKFFTGASHGVVSLNGIVSDENVKSLAEKRVARNPNVRGVINNIHVSGSELEAPEQPFLQPTIGANIYFLDGISGVVNQVIINPNNRRVVAMIVRAQFANQRQKLNSLNNGKAHSPERLVVLPMDVVRYMTNISGFLHINSGESNRYMDFDSAHFSAPKNGWKAPYPYCPDDVLFPMEKLKLEYQVLEQLPRVPFVVRWEEQPLDAELLDNDSLGG